MTTDEDQLRELCEAHGQSHVLRFWSELDAAGRERLSAQIAALDFERLSKLRGLLEHDPERAAAPQLAPCELFPLQRDRELEQRASRAHERGAAQLSEGRVGFLLVAGGQASRLGYEGPKGAYPVGPISGISLFAFHARRLCAAAARHAFRPTWYVMTSPANEADTRAHFAENAYFGLDPEQVFFFSQGMLPAFDAEGRILMSAKDSLFLAPDGHGGTLGALKRSGALAHAEERGIELFSYFQVDNPLARPADALFIGLHGEEQASMSSKVVSKRDAAEKVGVLGRIDGRLGCIEYSDLPASLREAREPSGQLTYRAGNIAVHILQRSFAEELTREGLNLPWHLARKTMRVLDESGREVAREGVKFESFIFDALGRSQSSITLEVERELEFSPLKNAAGEDSPLSVRRDLCRLFAGWCAAEGLALPTADSEGVVPVEVDPLYAEDLQGFRSRAPQEPTVSDEGHHYHPNPEES